LFADDIDLELRLARFEHLMERRLLLLNSVLLRQNPHNVHEWHKRVLLYEGKPHEVMWDICTIRCLHIVLWPLISGVGKLLFPLGFSDTLCSLQLISHVPLRAVAGVQSQVSPCGICGEKIVTGTGFSLSTLFSPGSNC